MPKIERKNALVFVIGLIVGLCAGALATNLPTLQVVVVLALGLALWLLRERTRGEIPYSAFGIAIGALFALLVPLHIVEPSTAIALFLLLLVGWA